jgi:hypothetical protein
MHQKVWLAWSPTWCDGGLIQSLIGFNSLAISKSPEWRHLVLPSIIPSYRTCHCCVVVFVVLLLVHPRRSTDFFCQLQLSLANSLHALCVASSPSGTLAANQPPHTLSCPSLSLRGDNTSSFTIKVLLHVAWTVLIWTDPNDTPPWLLNYFNYCNHQRLN